MHRRFQGAPTAEIRCPGGPVRVVVAEGFRLRLLGLMRLGAEEVEPLLIPRCRSIHMHGMRTPIDLAWLEVERGQVRVLEIVGSLGPGRHARAPKGSPRRATGALELPPGAAERLDLTRGDELPLT